MMALFQVVQMCRSKLSERAGERSAANGVAPAMPAPSVQPSASSTRMKAPVARCSR